MTEKQGKAKRTETRFPGWSHVRIEKGKNAYIGVALDLSKNGLCIECSAPIEKWDELTVTLHRLDATDPILTARVTWVSKIGCHIPGMATRLGLLIEDLKNVDREDYEHFLQKYSTASFEKGRLELIEVVVEGQPRFHAVKVEDLFFGGCYLASSDELPAVNDELPISFHVPTAPEPTMFSGKVIYVIDENTARSLGTEMGFGVRFIELTSGSPKAMEAFLGKHEPIFDPGSVP